MSEISIAYFDEAEILESMYEGYLIEVFSYAEELIFKSSTFEDNLLAFVKILLAPDSVNLFAQTYQPGAACVFTPAENNPKKLIRKVAAEHKADLKICAKWMQLEELSLAPTIRLLMQKMIDKGTRKEFPVLFTGFTGLEATMAIVRDTSSYDRN